MRLLATFVWTTGARGAGRQCSVAELSGRTKRRRRRDWLCCLDRVGTSKSGEYNEAGPRQLWIVDCGLWDAGCGLWIVDCGTLATV